MSKSNPKQRFKANEIEARGKSDKIRNYVILGLILTYTFLLFVKSSTFEFVNFDDYDYVVQNPSIQDLSFEGLKNIFTTPVIGMYNPLTFVVYAFEYHFWGLDPHGYHWVNIILHLIATITIFYFIYRLTGRYETALIVALFFAIHPMHVSVVTWASQTKTSLFLIFYFLALNKYVQYIRSNFNSKYLIYATLFFIFSVLSKPSAVTLAPMLFLIDYYLSRKIDKRLFLEKIPFFAIALCFGIVTFLTHIAEEDSIFDFNHDYSLINNLLVSNYSIVFYINKLFVPLNLCTIYPYPEADPYLPFKYYFSIPIIPFILWLVYKSGKFKKEMIFGILFFVIAVSVLLRIVPSGFFRAANRYTYLSYTGLFFIIGQYITYILDNKFSYSKRIKNYVIVFFCLLIVFFTYITTIRIQVWENSITLFTDIIKKKPKLALAYNNRSIAKSQIGDLKGAIEDVTKAIELDAKYASAYNNRAEYKRHSKYEEGVLEDYDMAIILNPKYDDAYYNRGNFNAAHGKYDKALNDFNKANQLNPKNANVYHNRAYLKLLLKDTAAAMEDWKVANEMGIDEAGKNVDILRSTFTSN